MNPLGKERLESTFRVLQGMDGTTEGTRCSQEDYIRLAFYANRLTRTAFEDPIRAPGLYPRQANWEKHTTTFD